MSKLSKSVATQVRQKLELISNRLKEMEVAKNAIESRVIKSLNRRNRKDCVYYRSKSSTSCRCMDKNRLYSAGCIGVTCGSFKTK
jgi:hypothetical protein